MRIAGHSERGLGPAQTTYFLFSESGDLPDHTYAEGSLEVKTSSAEGRATQRPLHTASSRLREVCTHTGGSWDTPNVDPGKSKWLAKVNSGKKWPIKVIQTDSRMCDSGTLSFPLSSPMCPFTRIVFFFLRINTLLISLLSVYVGILLCRTE